MSKHTPGPWGHKTWDINKDGEFNYTVEKDDKSICEIVGTGEQAEANARLIAAAPDLYETLCRMSYIFMQIVEAVEIDIEGTRFEVENKATGEKGSLSLREIFEAASKAIDKVHGETNE